MFEEEIRETEEIITRYTHFLEERILKNQLAIMKVLNEISTCLYGDRE